MKNGKKRTAAEQSKRMGTSKAAPRDPMQGQTRAGSKRGKGVKKAGKSGSGADRAQCTAHKRNGDRCSNPPVRGAKVCRMHGGSAPQVKAKANQRLIEMILPALAHLRKIIDNPDTADGDKLKAINMVLNRTGYSERQQIDLGLREPTAWDRLVTDGAAFSIRRGGDLAEELAAGAEHQQLPNPNDDSMGGVDDEALDALLDQRARWREREAQTRLDNSGHEVVPGDIGRTPDEPPEPGPSYEERLIERIGDPRRGRRP